MSSIDLKNIKLKPLKKRSLPALDLSILNKDISLGGVEFSDKHKEKFFSELSLLLTEGIDLKTAIELAFDETENAKTKKVYEFLKNKIINGSKLSTAIKDSRYFSDYDYHNISIGEESGRIGLILEELSAYYSQKMKWQRLLIGAISYPAIVVAVSFLAIFFLLNFIVPMFDEVFKRFNGKLPWITQMIIDSSNIVKRYGWILIIFVLVIIILSAWHRKKIWFRKATSYAIQRIPGLGPLLTKIYLARFCHTMSLMLQSKVSIITSLDLAQNMVGFYPIESSLPFVKATIIKGYSLNEALANHPIFDAKLVKMIRVGEEVNKTDEMFKKIASKYTEESEHQIELLNKLIEPFLIIFLGLIVSIILIAMYLPLFKLSSQIA